MSARDQLSANVGLSPVPRAHLHQGQLGLPLKVRDGPLEEVAGGHKVRVQDGHKLAVLRGRVLHAIRQVARLVASPQRAVQVEDGGAHGAPGSYLVTDEPLHVLLIRVIQHLVGTAGTGVIDWRQVSDDQPRD